MHFRESHVRANKLDVQETDISFTQFYRSWNNFSWCRYTHGWYPSSWYLEFGSGVFHSSKDQSNKTKGLSVQGNLLPNTSSKKRTRNQIKVPTKHDNLDLCHVDGVPWNVKFPQSSARLYVFEDNEAVIKIIIKGRSPTMRHVSRSHRVALEWLFDRIDLDPKIQIRYTDTRHQLADILKKGNFIRDEWNSLLHLFNISHFSSLCCAKNVSLVSCTKTMAKRMQEQKEDNRIVARSKPTAVNLAVTVSTSSSSVNSPIASKSPGILKAPSRQSGCSGKLDVRSKRNSNPYAASSFQGWQKDASLDVCAGKPVATERPGIPELSGDCLYRETCRNSRKFRRLGKRWQNLATPFPCTLQAAVHLGQDYTENLQSTKNQPLKSGRQLFRTTEKLIKDQAEITGLSKIDWKQLVWRETSLLCDRAVHIASSKTYVFSDSVLCQKCFRNSSHARWLSCFVHPWCFLRLHTLHFATRVCSVRTCIFIMSPKGAVRKKISSSSHRSGGVLVARSQSRDASDGSSLLQRILEAHGGSSDGETEALEGDAQAAFFLQLCEW